jgi:hypothetical protein
MTTPKRVLPEKLIVAELLKKLLAFKMKPEGLLLCSDKPSFRPHTTLHVSSTVLATITIYYMNPIEYHQIQIFSINACYSLILFYTNQMHLFI